MTATRAVYVIVRRHEVAWQLLGVWGRLRMRFASVLASAFISLQGSQERSLLSSLARAAGLTIQRGTDHHEVMQYISNHGAWSSKRARTASQFQYHILRNMILEKHNPDKVQHAGARMSETLSLLRHTNISGVVAMLCSLRSSSSIYLTGLCDTASRNGVGFAHERQAGHARHGDVADPVRRGVYRPRASNKLDRRDERADAKQG